VRPSRLLAGAAAFPYSEISASVHQLTDLSIIPTADAITAILARASATLDSAKSSAEILEARDTAAFAYDAAKSAARINRAKGAHDDLVDKARCLQGEALRIDARAKFRLAEEYDAAQERGEVAGHGGARNFNVPDENVETTVADIGLTRKDIFEARQVRDAEKERPGIVNEAIDRLLESGEEPTRAAVARAVSRNGGWFSQTTGNHEWYTPPEYVELAREVMGAIDVDPASNLIAQETVKAATFYTKDDDGLTKEWNGRVWLNPPYSHPENEQFVDKLIVEIDAGRTTEAILLTNNASETAWFQKAAPYASALCFAATRLRFLVPAGEQIGSPNKARHSFTSAPTPHGLRKCSPESA
jgi:DNA N-6-adenine-methyltransferase (Dam)